MATVSCGGMADDNPARVARANFRSTLPQPRRGIPLPLPVFTFNARQRFQ
ncbi:MAG TPA: hypothetical protein VM910_15820 [Bradyrhizobium sp.]|nr:hypothetical protein [Bradyrhizobium sp.]